MAILLTKIFVKPHGEIGVAYTNSKDGVYEGGHPDKVRIKAEMLCKRVLLGFTTITTPWTFPREEDRELFTELINQAFEYIRGKSGQETACSKRDKPCRTI